MLGCHKKVCDALTFILEPKNIEYTAHNTVYSMIIHYTYRQLDISR